MPRLFAAVQAKVRRRLLESFVRRGLLDSDAAHAMQAWQHGGGFSVDAAVRIEAADRARRERLLRYCARPPFALERLQQRDAEHLLYKASKTGPGGSGLQLLPHNCSTASPLSFRRRGFIGTVTTACWHRTRRCAPR